jgi:hypothetical protein
VRLEGLGELMKIIRLIGSRTRDLPACRVVLQPLRYYRAPFPGKFLALILFEADSTPEPNCGRIWSTEKQIVLIENRTRNLPACSIFLLI